MQEAISVGAVFGIPAAVFTGLGAWWGSREGHRKGVLQGAICGAFVGGPMLTLLLLGAILPVLNGNSLNGYYETGALFVYCAIFWLSNLGMAAPLACGTAYAAMASFGAWMGAAFAGRTASRLKVALTVALSSALVAGLSMAMLPKIVNL